MRSVKEVSGVTGVSIRTLHYYDEMDLLKPSHVTDAGYRQYSSGDVYKLQKILLLKEVGFSVAEIKKIMNNKSYENVQFFFEKQKELLILKKERLNGLIALVDSIMKGEKSMYFGSFNKKEIDNTFNAMLERLNDEETQEYILGNGGTLESAQEYFEQGFISYEGDLKHYLGEKEMSQVVKESPDLAEIEKSREILEELFHKLGDKRGTPIDKSILALIDEIRTVMVAMFPIEKQDELFQDMAQLYVANKEAEKVFDALYGNGAADYYYKCVKKFYSQEKESLKKNVRTPPLKNEV